MLALGTKELSEIARQKQTATSMSSKPSMSLQHGVLSGFSIAPTGRTGKPRTSAHAIFSLTVFFGQVSAAAGGDCCPGNIGGSCPLACLVKNKIMLKTRRVRAKPFELFNIVYVENLMMT